MFCGKIKNLVMEDGERFCLLVNKHIGLPMFYPNLFVTSQVWIKSLSLSAMYSALNGINILLRFMSERGEDIEERFSEKKYFEVHELDALRDFCQKNFQSLKSSAQVPDLLQRRSTTKKRVAKDTEYARLTTIAQYTKWLAHTLTWRYSDNTNTGKIRQFVRGIKTRRPPRVRKKLQTGKKD